MLTELRRSIHRGYGIIRFCTKAFFKFIIIICTKLLVVLQHRLTVTSSRVTCDRPRRRRTRTRLPPSSVPANDGDPSLSTPVRRRASCQVPRIWPHIVCFSISQRQFSCSVCHECCMYVAITVCSLPNSGVRSIRKPLDCSRTRTQTHGTFILQALIVYHPQNVGW
jgi:hypothetical protein